jgi:hypothetical protein
METEEEIELINNREFSGCLKNVRSQIFVPQRNRCYSAFDQVGFEAMITSEMY